MLIDTSRNGWGGSARPTAVSVSYDVNTYVDQSRLDRRINRYNWCNQVNAGIGERPVAAPRAGVDAYIWARPPGESDGASDGANRWCDPTFTPPSGSATGRRGRHRARARPTGSSGRLISGRSSRTPPPAAQTGGAGTGGQVAQI